MTEPTRAELVIVINRLEATIQTLTSAFEAHAVEVSRRLGKVEKDVGGLRKIANMGRGALWMLLTIGGATALVVTGVVWFLDYVRSIAAATPLP